MEGAARGSARHRLVDSPGHARRHRPDRLGVFSHMGEARRARRCLHEVVRPSGPAEHLRVRTRSPAPQPPHAACGALHRGPQASDRPRLTRHLASSRRDYSEASRTALADGAMGSVTDRDSPVSGRITMSSSRVSTATSDASSDQSTARTVPSIRWHSTARV